MLKINQITTDSVKTLMVKVLRECIGFKKTYNIEEAGDILGRDPRTIEGYLLGRNIPPLPTFLRMCKLFGPSFANRFMRMAGIDGAQRMAIDAVTDFQLNRSITQMLGELGEAFADGHIDHHERPDVLQAARHLMPILQDWIADNDRAPGDKGEVIDRETFLTRHMSDVFDA